jgi:hypothetical protein
MTVQVMLLETRLTVQIELLEQNLLQQLTLPWLQHPPLLWQLRRLWLVAIAPSMA